MNSLLSSCVWQVLSKQMSLLNHWAKWSASRRSRLIFQFPSTVQIFESFWFECVRVWSAHLPEIIFSLPGQGISCSMETYTLGLRLVCTCCFQQAFTALEDMPGPVVALAQKLIWYLEFLILQAGRGVSWSWLQPMGTGSFPGPAQAVSMMVVGC